MGVANSLFTPPYSRVRRTRPRWLLWLSAFGFLVALSIYPVSSRMTRFASVGLIVALWIGLLILLGRHRPVRILWGAVSLLTAAILVLPANRNFSREALRTEYLQSLQRFEGVTYYWGGETKRGIDCSGLVRRGMIKAMLSSAVRMRDPGLIRDALDLWWHDCSADDLRVQHRGLTVAVLPTTSLNSLDPSQIRAGDLAVNRVHIMAYLGDRRWIEADPEAGRVITVNTPAPNVTWFEVPMTIVRWSILQ